MNDQQTKTVLNYWRVTYHYSIPGESGTGSTSFVTNEYGFPKTVALEWIRERSDPKFTKLELMGWTELTEEEYESYPSG